MGDWTELLVDPRTVQAIFGQHAPSLSGVELHEIAIHRDGPSAVLGFDLAEFPAEPPAKWKAEGFNRVQVRLQAWGVQEILVEGMTTRPIVDIVLVREGGLIRVRVSGDGTLIDLRTEFVAVTSDDVSAYLDGNNGEP